MNTNLNTVRKNYHVLIKNHIYLCNQYDRKMPCCLKRRQFERWVQSGRVWWGRKNIVWKQDCNQSTDILFTRKSHKILFDFFICLRDSAGTNDRTLLYIYQIKGKGEGVSTLFKIMMFVILWKQVICCMCKWNYKQYEMRNKS